MKTKTLDINDPINAASAYSDETLKSTGRVKIIAIANLVIMIGGMIVSIYIRQIYLMLYISALGMLIALYTLIKTSKNNRRIAMSQKWIDYNDGKWLEALNKMINCTEDDIEEGTNGGCLACGEIQYGGVEPDARNYLCESCGENQVFGMKELLIMGKITLTNENDEAETED